LSICKDASRRQSGLGKMQEQREIEGSVEKKKAKKARHTILDVEDRTRGGNAPVDWILISFG
jgi:hypothetical protein